MFVYAYLQGNPLVWVVVDVSRQKDFRSAYGFSVDQLPALVALSTRRKRFAQGAAPFSEENAKQLVTKVLAGTAVTLPLPVGGRRCAGYCCFVKRDECGVTWIAIDNVGIDEHKLALWFLGIHIAPMFVHGMFFYLMACIMHRVQG